MSAIDRAGPKVSVHPKLCIGSGNCLFYAPNTFELDEAKSLATVIDPAGDPLDDILEAAEACPTQAITVDTEPFG